MKKILFLGAAKFQIPAIEYANKQGYFTITLDNQENNPGHKIAKKCYQNISTIDKNAVLKISKDEEIDGILSYGSDIAASTVAFVAMKLNLIGNPLNAVETLTNKAKFRTFLEEIKVQDNIFHAELGVEDQNFVLDKINFSKGPFIVKPVDSAGSKGVCVVSSRNEAAKVIEEAFKFSISKKVIIESYKEKKGYQICGDGFFEKGEISFVHYGNGHFYGHEVSLAPFAETFPSAHNRLVLKKTTTKMAEVLRRVGFKKGVFNFDVIIDEDDEPFIIEIGPRSGGNYIPVAIKYSTGVDLVAACVEASIDSSFKLSVSRQDHKLLACYMLHSDKRLVFNGVEFNKELEEKIIEKNIYKNKGEKLGPFRNASDVAGNIILKFDDYDEMILCVNELKNKFSFIGEAK